ncbi:YhcH/YjgK/YiaL family protein [Deltaproteobacteria bacterium TL4]
MILDVLENANCYFPLNRLFAKAFDFLKRPDLYELPVGKYEIEGDQIYARIIKEPGRKKKEAKLETHEKYIDIQLVLAGTDNMGWKDKSSCKKPIDDYEQEKDLQLFGDEPKAWISTKKGRYVIFFPEDAHMPMISKGQLHKVVIKVAVKP